ncbi:kinase-like domain-containing protein [Mycena alexandri]|uniref:Kinase-like domain-containing protein n=1 Tax=Mycena alexandri TaxID=1745969 RepID=A0AAD6TC39_9AGAR|nr:kinase-like domain-containing protein [Mycena alexandri]
MSVRSLGSSGGSSTDPTFGPADTTFGSGFEERNRTLTRILEQRWTIHPSIGTLLLVFKSFVGLELARRTTDPKVATLLIKVQDTMTGFVQTFALVKPGSENKVLLLRQVSDLSAAMALDIGDCGKLCQGYYQKSFTGKIFSKTTFDGKFRDMGRRLDERRRELDSILLFATSSSLQADVQEELQADVSGSSDAAMGSESSDPPPYTPGDGSDLFGRDKRGDRQQSAIRAANEEGWVDVVDRGQHTSPLPLTAWSGASSPTTDSPSMSNILDNVPALSFEDGDAASHIDAFLRHQSQRAALLAQSLSPIDLREALQVCEQRICSALLAILSSRDAKHAVLLLEGARAQAFLDAVQAVLDRGSLPSAERTSQARRLIIRLSEARDQLPTSLFISGVSDHDEHPTFAGGFGDIYRASFGGSMVALKRIRMFHAGSDSTRTRLQFCREALVWQTLHHKYILPLIGIDRETFPSSFCMVSPWMKNGTVLKYLSEHGRADVEKLLLQIAEGLGYLHSMKIVHGDLRGTNILVSDDWNVCLADFGLTGVIEDTALSATNGALTSSTNHAGSLRWFAPELMAPTFFGRERFVRTPSSDVYAFACVCLELHTGAPPFSEITPDVAAMLRVVAGERPARPEVMSDELWGLVTAAWAQKFQDRPGVDDVIESMKVLVAPKKYKFTLPSIPPAGPDDGLRAVVLYDYEVWQAHLTDVCNTQRSIGSSASTGGHSPQEGRDHQADYSSRR